MDGIGRMEMARGFGELREALGGFFKTCVERAPDGVVTKRHVEEFFQQFHAKRSRKENDLPPTFCK